jgi:hypothetical protein
MTHDQTPERVFSFDMSDLVQKSVATLYSHLITRPTGQAIRLGIESQICEHGGRCVCVLDFTQVVILDYSCADEAVAKLIQRFQSDERPADAYFIARGLAEQHREPLEEVLIRHGLVLVAQADGMGTVLLGAPAMIEQLAFAALEQIGFATSAAIAEQVHRPEPDVHAALQNLAGKRVVLETPRPEGFFALTALLALAETGLPPGS